MATTTKRPRRMTREECRAAFLDHLEGIAHYCTQETRAKTVREKIDLAIFSVLSAIDGSAFALPAFNLYPAPHPDDRAYRRRQGTNWWPEKDSVEIAGELHSAWAQRTPHLDNENKVKKEPT